MILYNLQKHLKKSVAIKFDVCICMYVYLCICVRTGVHVE